MTMPRQPKTWVDENGIAVPLARITDLEKLREARAAKIIKAALDLEARLSAFRKEIEDANTEVYEAALMEAGAEPEDFKGNHTWYSFDRSVKVEARRSERIEFDDALITAAKQKLDAFIRKGTNAVNEMIRQLIMDAFATARGQMDVKKVLGLVRYRTRIGRDEHPDFHEAIDLIEQAIRRPDSRVYYRVYRRAEDGEYVIVNLNFSAA
jgi:tRNA nucleotidyltransferase/poly(A) polymerase